MPTWASIFGQIERCQPSPPFSPSEISFWVSAIVEDVMQNNDKGRRNTKLKEKGENIIRFEKRRWDYGAEIAERVRRQMIPRSVTSVNQRTRQVEDWRMVVDILMLLLFLVVAWINLSNNWLFDTSIVWLDKHGGFFFFFFLVEHNNSQYYREKKYQIFLPNNILSRESLNMEWLNK